METKTLKFYKLGHQFLNSSKVLLEKLVENDNRQVVISNFEIIEEYYNEQTKYSDFNIIIPILFNYYHGLELIIKAALEQVGKLEKDRHNIEDLIKKLKKEYKEDENFINCIIEIGINRVFFLIKLMHIPVKKAIFDISSIFLLNFVFV